MTLQPVMIGENMKEVVKRFILLSLSSKRRTQIILRDHFLIQESRFQINDLLFSVTIKEMIFHFHQSEFHTFLVTFHQKYFILHLTQRYFEQHRSLVNVKHFAKHFIFRMSQQRGDTWQAFSNIIKQKFYNTSKKFVNSLTYGLWGGRVLAP